MHLLSGAQMRAVDEATIAAGTPGQQLMDNAAAAVVRLLERDYADALRAPIAVLAGPGNNGGDGLCAAAILRSAGRTVHVAALAPVRPEWAGTVTGDSSLTIVATPEAWQAWCDARLAHCQLLLDALFGVGLIRPLEGLPRQMVDDVNSRFPGIVVAVDMPSGLAADASLPWPAAPTRDLPVMRAARTVTFTAPKRGQFLDPRADAVGRLRVEPIGTADSLLTAAECGARLATPALCRRLLAPRSRAAHKGDFGHVLVVGGSLGKSGAAALAATAALRMGAGLVTAAVPRSVLPLVAAARPEIMTEPLAEDAGGALAGWDAPRMTALLRAATVLAIGPGLGAAEPARELARHLVQSARVPVVLDADGLNAYAGRRRELAGSRPLTLTPHPGEMARLFAVETAAVVQRPLYFAQRLAAEAGAVVVLKLHRSIVAAPDGAFFVNSSGNPGMATGGSGDVLTGFVAGLIAQHASAPLADTVAAAVYLHGRAGDAAAAARGEMSLLAGDLLDFLPAALGAVRRESLAPALPMELAP